MLTSQYSYLEKLQTSDYIVAKVSALPKKIDIMTLLEDVTITFSQYDMIWYEWWYWHVKNTFFYNIWEGDVNLDI